MRGEGESPSDERRYTDVPAGSQRSQDRPSMSSCSVGGIRKESGG